MGPPCVGATDCVASPWSDWTGCEQGSQMTQRFRVRDIVQPNQGGGKDCPKNIKETLGCGNKQLACLFTEWRPWSPCDRKCGAGQQRRERVLTQWMNTNNQSLCPDAHTQETKG